MSFCAKCGAKTVEGKRFCSDCGAAVGGAPDATRAAPAAPAAVQWEAAPVPIQAAPAADEKYCHACGAAIKKAAAICPKCGVSHEAPPERAAQWQAAPAPARAALGPDEKHCHACGAAIKRAAAICPKCGVSHEAPPAPAAPPPAKSAAALALGVVALALTAIGAFLGGVGSFLFHEELHWLISGFVNHNMNAGFPHTDAVFPLLLAGIAVGVGLVLAGISLYKRKNPPALVACVLAAALALFSGVVAAAFWV